MNSLEKCCKKVTYSLPKDLLFALDEESNKSMIKKSTIVALALAKYLEFDREKYEK